MATIKKLINTARYDYTIHKQKEVNDEPSMTVPDDTMDIRTIMDRFGAGRAIPTAIQEIYEEEGKTILDTSRMSKIEKAEKATELAQEVYQARRKLQQIEKYQQQNGTKYIDPNAPEPPTLSPTEETPTT